MAMLAAKRKATSTAKIDPVTGLGNGPMFSHEIEREMARYKRTGEPFSILVLATEPIYKGDPSRDTVVAEILRDLARSEDAPCHLKGRWFGVVLAGAREAGARAALARLRRETDWKPGVPLTQPLTGGVAEWTNKMADMEDLVERAYEDLATYDAAIKSESGRWLPNQP